jgi:hypothetical protein
MHDDNVIPLWRQRRAGSLIGDTARAAILDGLTNKEVLDLVHRSHPGCRTTLNCISTYRSRLRRMGEDVPTSLRASARRRTRRAA